jgi:UPF0271 protein
MRAAVDLNADVGEGYDESALMPELTSASVACGAHAGDDDTIRRTLALARAHGVTVGAHPGFPERETFGRRVTTRDPAEIERLVAAQIEHLVALAREAGVAVSYVKPHGALYNLAAADGAIACAVACAAARRLPAAPLVLLAGSPGLDAVGAATVQAIGEAFADRGLLASGELALRGTAGATIEDPERAAERALAIVRDGRVAALDGGMVAVRARTLCVHGDGPTAPAIARRIRERLREAGIAVAPFATEAR